MSRIYQKVPLSVVDLVARLEHRGLRFDNPTAATNTLRRVNYYRLSAYWRIFKKPDDTFHSSGCFEHAVMLYEFDRHLRLICLDMIERVEVTLRCHVAHQLATGYGAFAHEDATNLHSRFNHTQWQTKLHKETRRSKEPFVKHFEATYQGFPKLPIWVAGEVMSLGSISMLCSHLKTIDVQALAAPYSIPHKVFTSWWHALTYVRNVCAHHSRLWNRELAIKPKAPYRHPYWVAKPATNRIYGVLCVLRHLSISDPASTAWGGRVTELFAAIDGTPRFRRMMGVPEAWRASPFWRDVCTEA